MPGVGYNSLDFLIMLAVKYTVRIGRFLTKISRSYSTFQMSKEQPLGLFITKAGTEAWYMTKVCAL